MGTGLNRRKAIAAGTTFGAGAWMCGVSRAATRYPSQPINLIIPESPGGTFDAYGREFSRILQEQLKTNIEPTNVPGAGGAEAIFQIFGDAPDGYTLSLIGVPGGLLHKAQPEFDIMKLTWLANLSREPYGLATGANSSIKSFSDLKALSLKRPVTFAVDGPGSTGNFATTVLASSTGLQSKIVTGYLGSTEGLLATARGEVDVTVQSLATIVKMQTTNLVRLIFVFQDKSATAGIENAASLGKPELGQIFQWRSVVAPPGLPPQIASTLSAAFVEAAKSPDAKSWAVKTHATLYALNQQQTLQMVRTQQNLVDEWRNIH
jgi:tripartite-type tricarboxylate transporter receptor subunit TctC